MGGDSRFATMPTAARAVVVAVCLLVLAAAAFGVSRVAASAMTVNNVTGARQVTSGSSR